MPGSRPRKPSLTEPQRHVLERAAADRDGRIRTADRTLGILVERGFATDPRYSYGRRGHHATATITDAGRAAVTP